MADNLPPNGCASGVVAVIAIYVVVGFAVLFIYLIRSQ